jgi:hypothetical protein
VELAETHERFPSDNRDVKGTMGFDQLEEARDELGSLEIADLPESDATAEVFVTVCVATGTTERTFAGNLDRQRGTITAKDSPPRGDNTFHHSTIAGAVSP